MEGGDGEGEIDCRRPDSTLEEVEMETAVPPYVRKRKMEDEPMEDELEEEEEEEEVIRACVIEGSKHANGSFYRQDTHFFHRLYCLDDTRETLVKPTILVDPVTNKIVTEGRSFNGCALMQIFSPKLTNHSAVAPAAAPIMLYGFVAARDLLQPLRNYVFNRTRDDPLVLHRNPDDPSSPLPMQMAGPKRGIFLQARAMIEYDLRIKRAMEDEDLQLIDGAATFSERIRGDGDHGAAVDITLVLLRHAVEARIQVSVTKAPATGLSFSLSCYGSRIMHEINLFDGVVDRPGNIKRSGDVSSFVVAVAVVHLSPLILCFKVAKAGGDAQNGAAGQSQTHMSGYPAQGRGISWDSIPLDFGAIELYISWSNLD